MVRDGVCILRLYGGLSSGFEARAKAMGSSRLCTGPGLGFRIVGSLYSKGLSMIAGIVGYCGSWICAGASRVRLL